MADIKQLTVLPRPRNAWQAMDAGFTLARAHYINLVILWSVFSLPIFSFCLYLQFSLDFPFMIIIWWWFKPLYELPLLFYLSKALFSDNMTKRNTIRTALANLWLLFKTYLTVARLSTARAMTYPVVFLEKLPWKKRGPRIRTLTTVPTRHYLLMLCCLHIEYILTYAIAITFVLMFLPSVFTEIDWENWFEFSTSELMNNFVGLTSVVSFLAAAAVAPFYVAGGFLIYINRRMQLEAWDIEHRFRSVVPKTTGLTAAILLTVFLYQPGDVNADVQNRNLSESTVVQEQVNTILDHKEFGKTEMGKSLRFKKKKKEPEDFEVDNEVPEFMKWLSNFMGSASGVVRTMLWIALGLFIVLLIYTISKFARIPEAPSALNRDGSNSADASSHPLTQDLPKDIVALARRALQQGNRREALSLLFRGALRSIMTEYDMKIARGATEKDCQTSISTVARPEQQQTFSRLLGVWQQEAYANQPQDEAHISSLIDEWKQAFATKAPSVEANPSS